MTRKVVLAYSGGLDTSVAVRWIAETYGCEIVCFCADVGQDEDLEAARAKALAVGAQKAIVSDLRLAVLRAYGYPALRAGAIAHGGTGKVNDQVRFELAAYHFRPGIKIIAPWREWKFRGRRELIEYTRQHKIPIDATAAKPYSVDRNLLHTSYEGGVLEDPWREPDPAMFQRTRDAKDAPAQPRILEIDVEHGDAVALDGERLGPGEMLTRLTHIAGG